MEQYAQLEFKIDGQLIGMSGNSREAMVPVGQFNKAAHSYGLPPATIFSSGKLRNLSAAVKKEMQEARGDYGL